MEEIKEELKESNEFSRDSKQTTGSKNNFESADNQVIVLSKRPNVSLGGSAVHNNRNPFLREKKSDYTDSFKPDQRDSANILFKKAESLELNQDEQVKRTFSMKERSIELKRRSNPPQTQSESQKNGLETSSYNRSVVGHDFLQVIDTVSYTEGDLASQAWREELRESLASKNNKNPHKN